MRRLAISLIVILTISSAALHAQTQPPPQTARQALIEMFFGSSANHLEKHLPDITRKSFQKMSGGNGQTLLAQFSMIASQAKALGAGLQTFDTGPTLLTAEDPRSGTPEKFEITVERDDLSGDEDQIEVALHASGNAKEQTLPFIPHFTFVMKTEHDVWRLNEISVNIRLPLADPDFLKNIEDRQRGENEQIVIWSIRSVTAAEKAYSSAQGGYSCTLSGLATGGKGPKKQVYLYDSQLASGKKNGYIFAISGCDGSHYKIVAEPEVADSGQRAFCSDEGGELRASPDGKATSCISHGDPVEDGSGNKLVVPAVQE